jgi:hypothetical protein
MPKLSESQLVVLTAACQHDDGCAFPITSKLKGNAAGNVLKSLLAKGLLKEVKASRDDTVWRHDEDQGSLTLQATPTAYTALGMEATDGGTREEAAPVPTRRAEGRKVGSGRGRSTKAAVRPARGGDSNARRTGTKQADLIAMLRRPEGTTIEEVVKTFGWQPHTVRGAIAGALKKKLGLDVRSEKVEGRGRVYRISD